MQVVDVAFVGELLELVEQVPLVRDYFLFRRLIVVEVVVEVVRVRDVVDRNRSFFELLVRHGVQAQS